MILQIASTRIKQKLPVCLGVLVNDCGCGGPIVVKINFQCGAAAIGINIVVVIFDEGRIVDRQRSIAPPVVVFGRWYVRVACVLSM